MSDWQTKTVGEFRRFCASNPHLREFAIGSASFTVMTVEPCHVARKMPHIALGCQGSVLRRNAMTVTTCGALEQTKAKLAMVQKGSSTQPAIEPGPSHS